VEQRGFFAAQDGWRKCLDDLWQLNRRIVVEHPTLPVVLIGQSIGSLMALHFLGEHPDAVRGVVFAGMVCRPARLAFAGMIARIERFRLGPHGMSPIVHALSCGGFNRRFEPARTEADWLSRDPVEVDKYIADPLCRFRPSVQLWIDVLQAMNGITDPVRLARIPKRLPIYLIAGTEDPVAGSGLEQLLSSYRAAGLQHVTYRFYPGARHALFSETNRYEVTEELLVWLDETTGRRPSRHDGRNHRPRRGHWA
jgi:alpha-beta hydrolase superfamily lysophospholipase